MAITTIKIIGLLLLVGIIAFMVIKFFERIRVTNKIRWVLIGLFVVINIIGIIIKVSSENMFMGFSLIFIFLSMVPLLLSVLLKSSEKEKDDIH